MKCLPLAILLVTIVSAPVSAGYEQTHKRLHQPPTASQKLSPRLRQLLIKEMLALQKGMKLLVAAIISGNWDKASDIGSKIHDSYILKQKLTKAQAEELHRTLPVSFQEMDQALHQYAAKLAQAAKNKNAELTVFYFYKMTDACLGCHTRYATHRFPHLRHSGSTRKQLH